MAAKHWIRDVLWQDNTSYIASGHQYRSIAAMYHFLRTAGWKWLWECDGDRGPHDSVPNHIDDGNMQAPGVTHWTAVVSGVPTKDTSIFKSGGQSLKIVASALGDGAVSDALADMNSPGGSFSTGTGDSLTGPVNGIMTYTDNTSRFNDNMIGTTFTMSLSANPTNNGSFPIVDVVSANTIKIYNPAGVAESYITPNPPTTPGYVVSIVLTYRYELAVWAYNNGVLWDVEVDPGSGAFSSVGTLPVNGGVWTLYHFTFHVTSTGSVKVRFVGSGAGTIYIGGAMCFRSAWEYAMSGDGFSYTGGAPNRYGSDGVLSNPDQFSTGGSYSPGTQDIGKHLFVWDPTNNANSGCYEIIADLGGGSVQVDLRSPTAAFVAASGLSWRIITITTDLSGGGLFPTSGIYDWLLSTGFGLESPHTSKWRLFHRFNWYNGQTGKTFDQWSAPGDTDFDFSNGAFYMDGPSIQRNRGRPWSRGGTTEVHSSRGQYNYFIGNNIARTFLMTDADGSFVCHIMYDINGDAHNAMLVGYLGTDPYHPGIMSFFHFAPWGSSATRDEIVFNEDNQRWASHGTGFKSDGESVQAGMGQLGYGTTDADVNTRSGARANPFSGNEWVHRLFLALDPNGWEGAGGEMDSDCGVFQGRNNMAPLTTFDSDNYLHIDDGLVWEWSGEQLV